MKGITEITKPPIELMMRAKIDDLFGKLKSRLHVPTQIIWQDENGIEYQFKDQSIGVELKIQCTQGEKLEDIDHEQLEQFVTDVVFAIFVMSGHNEFSGFSDHMLFGSCEADVFTVTIKTADESGDSLPKLVVDIRGEKANSWSPDSRWQPANQ